MSDTENKPAAYSGLQKALHWIIAITVIGMVPAGLTMTMVEEGPIAAIGAVVYNWHKLVGFSILVLMVIRLAVRVRRGVPSLPSDMPSWQAVAARAVHRALYTLLFVVPLLGWAGITAYPALDTVGGFHLPPMPFVPQDKELAGRIFSAHGLLALTLALLALGHTAAALQHLVIQKDGVFEGMWPGRSR